MSLMLYLRNHLHIQVHLGFLLLSSRSFIVSCFIFKSMIHFELLFMKSISSVSKFIYLQVAVQLSSTICWEDYLCSTILSFLLCHRSVDYIHMGIFLDSLVYFIDLFIYFFTNITLSWLLKFHSKFCHWAVSIFRLCSSPSISSWLSVSFASLYKL